MPHSNNADKTAVDNEVYYAMAEQSRRVLVRVLERDGRIGLDRAIEELPDSERAWYHSHLPRLVDSDIIAYDDRDIVPGRQFDTALALVEAFDNRPGGA